MKKSKISGATIPYQLRPRKAIERNIFVDLLKRLSSYNKIDFQKYRYVGFGAAYLEDFKQMHLELGIITMDCIEMDENAYTRQIFNNPYYFVNSYNASSTEYIDCDIKYDKNQIIWLDFTSPGLLRQQLSDIEMLCSKLGELDIIKFTFNSNFASFISSHHIKNTEVEFNNLTEYPLCSVTDLKNILRFLKDDPTLNIYLPEEIDQRDLMQFDKVIRAMAVRAIKRGLKQSVSHLNFQHLTAFTYADGQKMTTISGIISSDDEFNAILSQNKIREWPFYNNGEGSSEFMNAIKIAVPDMTVAERIEIDKKIPSQEIEKIAEGLNFFYGGDLKEHVELIKGYHTFYKYLPYFSKVIY